MRLLEITWPEFDRAVLTMAELVQRARPKSYALFGVPRGGLPLAVALSHRVGLPVTRILRRGIMVVDDIVDSGATVERLRAQRPGCHVVTWFIREGMKLDGVASVAVAPAGAWLVFPWEDREKALEDRAAYLARVG
jgi:hypoxanthine phosphoribosyltransferase